MEFTGERVIPGLAEHIPLFEEHLARYLFAGDLVRGRRVLDLGCGTGYGCYYLSQKGARLVIGTDVDGEAVQYARLHYKASNLAYFQSDASHLPLRPQIFDVVVSFEVIEHLRAATAFLAEVSRVMLASGWLIGSTPNKALHSPDTDSPYNHFHWREYDSQELESLLREYFHSVLILGQRPLYGFVIGPVPVDLSQDMPVVEFLPASDPLECSVTDSKDLIYLAGNPDAQVDVMQRRLGSHCYLGQPASRYIMGTIAHTRRLETENSSLKALIKGYQSGRFIRFMNIIHRWRSRIFTSRRF